MATRIVPDDFADIATALGAANNSDTIVVRDGTYTGANNRNIDPAGLGPLKIVSSEGEHRTIIDCQTAGRGFLFDNGESRNVILDGFTIENGYLNAAAGAGISIITGSSPTIRNCIVKDCLVNAQSAGGILIYDGCDPLLENVLIYDCESANHGGGIYVGTNSDPTMNNVTVVDNIVNTIGQQGGGICIIDTCTVTMTNCIIWGNVSGTGNSNQIYIDAAGDTLNYNFSCYGNAAGDVLNNGTFNPVACTTADPLFVTGPYGDYHLSQVLAGQAADSPCLDTGAGDAITLGFRSKTTRSDSVGDTGTVDMGYHYRGFFPSGLSPGHQPNLRWKPLRSILSISSLDPGETSAPGGRLDLRKKIALAITCEATFNEDATTDLVIHVITCPDDDDYAGAYDTQDFTQLVVECDPGETVRKTIAINAPARFVKVYAAHTGQDYPITGITVWAAPLGCEELPEEELTDYYWG